MINSLHRTLPVNLGRGWHTTTFRWLAVYAVIFALAVLVLIGFIGWSVTTRMEIDTDSLLHWQMVSFESIPDRELPSAIQRRVEQERLHNSYFGLFAANGAHLAGDILTMPDGLAVVQSGMGGKATGTTLVRSVAVMGRAHLPVIRAIAQARPDGSRIVIARDLRGVLSLRDATLNALVGGGVILLFVSIGAGLLLSVRQMRRVHDIHRVTVRIAQGDLNQRLPIGGRDELDMLAHLVNHMLDEIERLMDEVKGACDGIAHDLRTPLAHIRTLLGNAAQRSHTMADEASAQLIEQARRETDMLLERFRAMLRISEISGLKRRSGFAQVDLTALVKEMCELYEPLAEDGGVNLVTHLDAMPAIHGDRSLLFEAFSNLLDNAIKFSPEGGMVRVTLTVHLHGPRLTVTDNGPGIPEHEREAVLQRFYRGADARRVLGSGLGLSIVSAVMRLHDFTLHVGANEEPGGTVMSVECWPHALD
ncbi:ATP-binding protein [Caballeronia sp. DA-9]|uniref:sensor histidine kinase n=1 Tax=Caballeronia sp. DA-9 TaxID=3436237 RepID=UPI003F664E9A